MFIEVGLRNHHTNQQASQSILQENQIELLHFLQQLTAISNLEQVNLSNISSNYRGILGN
jgi:hypothetical protein